MSWHIGTHLAAASRASMVILQMAVDAQIDKAVMECDLVGRLS